MKRSHYLIGVIAASILTAGLTAYGVSTLYGSKNTKKQSVEFLSNEAGSHFTTFSTESYPDLTYAAENAVKAVVNIEKIEEVKGSSRQFDPFFEFFGIPQGVYEGEATPHERRTGGSGVIISSDGYIVTNNHVVENATRLKIKLNDNRSFEGKVIGTDPTTDVALIKIDAQDLPTLAFGSSDELRLGEWVLAIGSPFDLQWTVTAGIVSAKARNLSVIPSQFGIESFIQTDAAINPGNSGGALVNIKGELVGINTVIKSPTGSYAGYSFAIPESIVKKVVVDLKEYGMVQRAMLGITFQEINSDFIEREGEQSGITQIGGVYITDVDPNGAAAAVGIKKGDVMTHIDGIVVEGTSTVFEQIAKRRPNDKIDVSIKRDNKTKHYTATLRNKAGKAELLTSDYVDVVESLGASFVEVNDKLKKELKIESGVQVASIQPNGVISKARIKTGYIITHINDKKIGSVSDITKISERVASIDGVYPNGRAISYTIIKEGE